MKNVSVVMAVYNGRQFLRQQVDSVLTELLPGDEFIIVDDDSTDSSLALLSEYASPAMRVLKNPKNLGVAATFERALRIADRDIVFLCDQDDIWLPGKRAAFVAAFDAASDALAVISDAEIIDANGQVVAPSFMATRQGFDGSLLGTLWRNRYLGCSMAIRRSLLAVALPLPALAPMHDMWLGAMARTFGSVVYLPTPLLQYRRHGGNVTPATRQGLPTMIRLRMALFAAVCLRTLSCRLGIHPRLAAHTARSKAHGRATE